MDFEIKDLLTDKALCERYIPILKKCEWGAGRFLAECIVNNSLFVDGDSVIVMLDGDKPVSFLTLAKRDCIEDDSLFPWIGFVYTYPDYRGHRYSGTLIRYALERARERGYKVVYLATDHVGFYEKYGFEYMENRLDFNGEDSRIYMYRL